ncbi:MAG: ABC transporter permease, partial [Chitinophagaceae bacterium]
MLKNYIKIAFRNLKRNKMYAALNVVGLGIGIAASLLIFIVIKYETSFDNFHPDSKNIYRVGSVFNGEDGIDYSSGVSFPVADALRIDYPQLKQVAAIYKRGAIVTTGDEGAPLRKKFNEGEVYFAEPSFFRMFNFTWLAGTPETALSGPGSVAISQEIAEKYFGDWKSAVGQNIKFNNKDVYKVTGILNNVPVNTDFPLKLVASYSSLKNSDSKDNLNNWVNTYSEAYVFVKLPDNLSSATFNTNLVAFAKKHKPAEYSKDVYIAQPLNDVHFNDEFGNFADRTFSRSLITALTLISIFLIVIACVNFINLSTAQAINRSKEVGVRKVMGSNRLQLALQFISETAIITVFAMILAVIIANMTLPLVNTLLHVKMSIGSISFPKMLLFLAGLAVVVTLLSGFYPALIVSGFNPITALRNKVNAQAVGGLSLRRVLVVLQFAIAHVLIIATLIVVSQTDYFKTASLGFEKSAIVNVRVPGDSISRSKLDYLRGEILRNPGIQNVSFSFASPADNGNWSSDFKFDHATKSTNFGANLKWADVEYFKIYNLKFIAGRPYEASDTVREFVVNETLLKKLGITDPKHAIGKQIDFWDGNKVGSIVGVVNDFNSYSLRQPMAPVVLAP